MIGKIEKYEIGTLVAIAGSNGSMILGAVIERNHSQPDIYTYKGRKTYGVTIPLYDGYFTKETLAKFQERFDKYQTKNYEPITKLRYMVRLK